MIASLVFCVANELWRLNAPYISAFAFPVSAPIWPFDSHDSKPRNNRARANADSDRISHPWPIFQQIFWHRRTYVKWRGVKPLEKTRSIRLYTGWAKYALPHCGLESRVTTPISHILNYASPSSSRICAARSSSIMRGSKVYMRELLRTLFSIIVCLLFTINIL